MFTSVNNQPAQHYVLVLHTHKATVHNANLLLILSAEAALDWTSKATLAGVLVSRLRVARDMQQKAFSQRGWNTRERKLQYEVARHISSVWSIGHCERHQLPHNENFVRYTLTSNTKQNPIHVWIATIVNKRLTKKCTYHPEHYHHTSNWLSPSLSPFPLAAFSRRAIAFSRSSSWANKALSLALLCVVMVSNRSADCSRESRRGRRRRRGGRYPNM